MGPLNDPLAPPPAAPPPGPPPTPPGDLPAAPPPAMPPPPSMTVPSPVQPEVTQASGGSSKKPMMIAVIIVLLIAILGVGGFFAFNGMNKKPAEQEAGTNTGEMSDTTDQDIENLNTEIEQIEIADPAGDLMEIDQQITAIDASASPSAAVKPSASTKASPSPKASAATPIDR